MLNLLVCFCVFGKFGKSDPALFEKFAWQTTPLRSVGGAAKS